MDQGIYIVMHQTQHLTPLFSLAQETVHRLEEQLGEIRAYIEHEAQALPKVFVWQFVRFSACGSSTTPPSCPCIGSLQFPCLLQQLEALGKALLVQMARLSFLANNLPTHLPGQPSRSTFTETRGVEPPAADECKQRESTEEAAFGNENASDNLKASQPSTAEGGGIRKKRPPAPRRCALSILFSQPEAVTSKLEAITLKPEAITSPHGYEPAPTPCASADAI